MLESQNKEIRFCLSDLFHICKLHKKTILCCAVFFACFGIYSALSKPIQYTAKATFREKGKTQVGLNNIGFSSLLLAGSENSNSEAITTLKSHTFLERVVKKMGFQGNLKKKRSNSSLFGNIIDNLWVEYALFYGRQSPFFRDKFVPIALKDINYSGECPILFRILFLPDDTFELMRSRVDTPLKGKIGIPVVYQDISFTIYQKHPENIAYQEYQLLVMPLPYVLDSLSKMITVESDREDKSLLNLSYTNSDRHVAAETLNILMSEYGEHLRNEQQRVSLRQIEYLQTRYDQMTTQLKKMMEEHAAILSSDVVTMGFPDANSAINFFAEAQQQYIRELLNNELELKRLQQMQNSGEEIYHKYTPENVSSPIASFISQIRQLKRQGDSIELALREHPNELAKERFVLADQFEQLSTVQKLSEETSQLIASIDTGKNIFYPLDLLNDPRYMIKSWCEKLKDLDNQPQAKEQCLNQLRAYLGNLSHLFSVQEQAIKERMSHHRNAHQEFNGIDLATAKELYINYSKELNIAEAEMMQKRFILEQMKDPKFEMSSLCTVLADPISQRMVAQAGTILLSLQDQNNRSAKEQERLRGELEVEKGFLSSHLNQTIQLLQLREKLLKDKIRSLQSATLDLIQQEISVLQKHLKDHIQTRMDNLKIEKNTIVGHQQGLQHEMAKLPNKWVAEKLINQQMDMNSRLVEELTRMVESKNTTNNLEIIQSAPVDKAFIPVKPKPPRTIFLALFGAIVGIVLSITYYFLKAIFTGMPITLENLKLAGFHTSGMLSKRYQGNANKILNDQDLNTLRRLASFLTENSFPPSTALIVGLKGPDYTQDLACLLAKRGYRILIMSLSFQKTSDKSDNGLLQYLEGKIEEPTIHKFKNYDLLDSGGITRFGNELLEGSRFQKIMHKFQSHYDWIIAITQENLSSAEVETLMRIFNYSVITITNETWKELYECKPIVKKDSATFLPITFLKT